MATITSSRQEVPLPEVADPEFATKLMRAIAAGGVDDDKAASLMAEHVAWREEKAAEKATKKATGNRLLPTLTVNSQGCVVASGSRSVTRTTRQTILDAICGVELLKIVDRQGKTSPTFKRECPYTYARTVRGDNGKRVREEHSAKRDEARYGELLVGSSQRHADEFPQLITLLRKQVRSAS